jgi:Flp pilus assembly protein TadD
VRIKPNYTEAHYNLGVVLARQGNLKEAIKHFSEALRVRPEDEKIHNSLGISLMLQGNIKEAARHFSEALRIKPDYGKARRNLESVRRYMRKTR